MKKILLYTTLLILLFSTSCSKWLDVKPKAQSAVDELFEEIEGFQNTLIGCYMKLNDRSLYGQKLTMEIPEYLTYHWDKIPLDYESIRDLNYKSDVFESTFSSIYLDLYNVVAQANILLENIDNNNGNILKDEMKAVIKGEALAIRAFCHFDVLRLFGQLPKNPTQKVNLIYADTLTKGDLKLYDDASFKKEIIKDLDIAEALLKDNDKYIFHPRTDVNVDLFYRCRTNRFNYYAVLALKARAYLYFGEKDKAYKYAKMVKDAKNNGSTAFELASAPLKADYTLTNESLLFFTSYDNVEHSTNLFIGDLYINEGKVENDLFKNKKLQSNNRYINLWGTIDDPNLIGGSKVLLKKYVKREVDKFPDDPDAAVLAINVPILRMSEMYLIMIETAPTLNESSQLFKDYMEKRGEFIQDNHFLDKEQLIDELEREYRIEFYGEGQMFYYYKRMGSKQMLWRDDIEIKEENYVIPLPKEEIKSGLN